MAIKRINPSRNAEDNTNRGLYGYVIRVPRLPDAHQYVVDFIVFNESDNCFYKCVEIDNSEQHYYTWRKVTFGASRAYLIPVGKLTNTDNPTSATTAWTEKQRIECFAKTLNEIAFGLVRYKVTVEPLGYAKVNPTGSASITYVSGLKYYKWVWNDTMGGMSLETHKHFTGDFGLLVEGTDYTVGTQVATDVYATNITTDGSGNIAWDSLTQVQVAAKINELGDIFNSHEADIPPASESYTWNQLGKIINLIIDEVNPFAIPWQLLLNRMFYLETEVGPATMETQDDTVRETRINLAAWADVNWVNYVGTDLLYGTVCQVEESTLKLIKSFDDKIGNISLVLSATYPTLIEWLLKLRADVDELKDKFEYHNEGIQQLKNAIGEVGFMISSDLDVFQDLGAGNYYYFWNSTFCYFEKIPSTEYTIGVTTIAQWKAAHPTKGQVYTFVPTKTAQQLIAKNAADILTNTNLIIRNKQALDDILGQSLKRIYIEKLDAPTAGETYYYYDRTQSIDDHPFIPFVAEAGKTLAYYNELYHSPIFALCSRNEYVVTNDKFAQAGETYYKLSGSTYTVVSGITAGDALAPVRTTHGTLYVLKQTAAVQIRVNNEEIAHLNYSFRQRCGDLDIRVEKLKRLTGVSGPDAVPAEWIVDGYVLLDQPGVYKIFKKYYRYDSTTEKFIELIAGSEAQYAQLTTDTVFQSGKAYYYKNLGGALVLGRSNVEYPTEYDYVIGTGVEANTWYNRVPGKYQLTHDENVKEAKNYYYRHVDTSGNYTYEVITGLTVGQAIPGDTFYERFAVDYVVPYYALTTDATFQGSKVYYVIDAQGHYAIATVTPGEDVPANTYYEYHNMTPLPANYAYIRKARKDDGGYEENNTHRGLIDRNTKDIEDARHEAQAFQNWTKDQLKALEDFVMSLLLSTLDVITQERATLSLLHETVGKLITIHNALERLNHNQTWKPADGIFDSGYNYYCATFELTEDTVFSSEQTYYVYVPADNYYRACVAGVDYEVGTAIPEDTYYVRTGYRQMVEGVDYEIGLEVPQPPWEYIYTKDLVIATTENYTLTEIRQAVNRVLRYHISTGELPNYTELPDTSIILESMTYWRYIDEAWESVVPEEDDPTMIGQRIKDYDPDHKWYINTGVLIPDGSEDNRYTETPVRIYLNELIKMHRKNPGTNTSIFSALSMIDQLNAYL